jgi:hypothetical protein
VVYVALVALAHVDLLRIGYPDWTGWGQADKTARDDDEAEESGWFRAWLKRQKMLWLLTEHHPFIAETDIANFFPSIPIESLLDHVLENSRLDGTLVRLLGQMLRAFHHLPEYRNSVVVGLPQEPMDASRVLAHSYLVPVDREFVPEGQANGYTRWMDDVVIGAESESEAHKKIARVQRCLEKLGLYPNTAKTRVVEGHELQRELLKDINDYLGEVDAAIKAGTRIDTDDVITRLRAHLGNAQPTTAWQRVLKRFYTVCRDLRVEALRPLACAHMSSYPSLSASALDYLLNWPITPRLVNQLFSIDADLGKEMRKVIADYSLKSSRRLLPLSGRIREATSAALLCAKFGSEEHVEALVNLATPDSADNLFRRQALIIGLASGSTAVQRARSQLARFADDSYCSFVEGLLDRDRRACQSALDRAAPPPVNALRPEMRPQPLFLAAAVRRLAPEEWKRKEGAWRKRLLSRPLASRDRAAERWLLGEPAA